MAIIVIEFFMYNNYFLLDFFIFVHSPNLAILVDGHMDIALWTLLLGHYHVDIILLMWSN